jgi:hypothetical protein
MKTPETNKSREMTLPAICKRFDYGSWDHADLAYLYKRAGAANRLGAAIRASQDSQQKVRPSLEQKEELQLATEELLAATE